MLHLCDSAGILATNCCKGGKLPQALDMMLMTLQMILHVKANLSVLIFIKIAYISAESTVCSQQTCLDWIKMA